MSERFAIRRGTPDDAEAIAAVHHAVWTDESIQPGEIAQLLAEESHWVHLVEDAAGVIGYADGFITRNIDDRMRWELDLLAVHPEYRRRGIGYGLIEAQTRQAQAAGVDLIRGLVRIENQASQLTFARADYQHDATGYQLYITSISDKNVPNLSKSASFVPVRTFSYQGFWVEGAVSRKVLESIQTIALPQGVHVAGILLTGEQVKGLKIVQLPLFKYIGDFQWWQKTFNKNLNI